MPDRSILMQTKDGSERGSLSLETIDQRIRRNWGGGGGGCVGKLDNCAIEISKKKGVLGGEESRNSVRL